MGIDLRASASPGPVVRESSEALSLVHDTKLNAKVDLWSTEHIFDRRGRPDGPREVWERKERLGQGAYGTVWLEECSRPYRRNTPTVRAVKEIFLQAGDRNQVDYTRELLAFAKFSQPKFEPYFVRSFGWYSTAESVFITTAYHQLGDLQRYLNVALPEDEVRIITEQLLEGLKHMHDNGFAHRDLKPKNVLVGAKGPRWSVQITDFGISKKLQDGHVASATMFQGSPGFMAPEMIVKTLKGPHYAVDLWSLGSMSYYMLTNRMILRDLAQLHEYGKGRDSALSTDYADVKVTNPAKDFISRLLARDPGARPTADEALAAEWMSDFSMYPSAKSDAEAQSPPPESQAPPETVAPERDVTNMDDYFASRTWSSEMTNDLAQPSSSSTPAPSSKRTEDSTLKPLQQNVLTVLPTRPKSSSEAEHTSRQLQTGTARKDDATPSMQARKRTTERYSQPAQASSGLSESSTDRPKVFDRRFDMRPSRSNYLDKDATMRAPPILPNKEIISRRLPQQMQDYRIGDSTSSLPYNASGQPGAASPRRPERHFSGLLKKVTGNPPSLEKVRIIVQPPDVPPIYVDVYLNLELFGFKNMISVRTGIPVHNQKLHFAGKELKEDTYALVSLGLHNQAVVYVTERTVHDADRLKKDHVYILVKENQRFMIRFNPNCPVLAIKEDIEEREGIPVVQQMLTLNGVYLDNAVSARRYGIRTGEILTLGVSPGPNSSPFKTLAIIVKTSAGQSFDIMLFSEESIMASKKRIEDEQRIPALRQKLLYNGEELENEATIRKYKIRSGDTINLIYRGDHEMEFANHKPVFIKMLSGKIFHVAVDPAQSVREIKHSIERVEGTSADRQRLVFNGQHLDDDISAEDYRIRRHDTLHLLIRAQPQGQN